MALDFDLINRATAYSIDKLESNPAVGLVLFDDFLLPELVDKLINFLNTADIQWNNETDQSGKYSMKHRKALSWVFDTVVEEAHIVFENLTTTLNQRYNRNNKFLGISIWRDTEQYTINRHSDNPIIDIAMQIYLTTGPGTLGTWFDYNGKAVQANYQINSGYLTDNTARIEHWLDVNVPADHVRYSVYARWMKNND